MTTDTTLENLDGLVSPEDLGVDLADEALARSLPLAALSIAIGAMTPHLRAFLDDPANAGAMATLESFGKWCDGNVAINGTDPWLNYLATSRASLLDVAWASYDPSDSVVDPDILDLPGDTLLGASIFFSFLEAESVISAVDESRWANLYHFVTFDDLFTAIAGDSDADSVSQPEGNDEW
jgi:hypothetical protein